MNNNSLSNYQNSILQRIYKKIEDLKNSGQKGTTFYFSDEESNQEAIRHYTSLGYSVERGENNIKLAWK